MTQRSARRSRCSTRTVAASSAAESWEWSWEVSDRTQPNKNSWPWLTKSTSTVRYLLLTVLTWFPRSQCAPKSKFSGATAVLIGYNSISVGDSPQIMLQLSWQILKTPFDTKIWGIVSYGNRVIANNSISVGDNPQILVSKPQRGFLGSANLTVALPVISDGPLLSR